MTVVKWIVLGVVIAVVLLVGWFVFFSGESDTPVRTMLEENLAALNNPTYAEAAQLALAPKWEDAVRVLIRDNFSSQDPKVLAPVGRQIWNLGGDRATAVVLEFVRHSNVVVAQNAQLWYKHYNPGALLNKLEEATATGTAQGTRSTTTSAQTDAGTAVTKATQETANDATGELLKMLEKELLAATEEREQLERKLAEINDAIPRLKIKLEREVSKFNSRRTSQHQEIRAQTERMVEERTRVARHLRQLNELIKANLALKKKVLEGETSLFPA